MSAGSQWVRRSPSSKQGPLKATLPVSSVTRQNTNANVKRSSLSSLSPSHQYKSRASPDTGLRSPGSINYKGKCKTLCVQTGNDFSNNSMRRTASLDAIYLTGYWPREPLYLSNLQVDRSTQTEEWCGEHKKSHRNQESSNEDKLDKFIKHRMQRAKEATGNRDRSLSLLDCADGHTQRHRMRSSIEGLNQEIERLVLKSNAIIGQDRDDSKACVENTPEGHRAPVADLLRHTRSVNTQTPAYTSTSNHSSGPPSRCSGSPVGSTTNQSDSRPPSDLQAASDSSPEQEGRNLGTSPRINKFLAREPPDGCERVSLKFQEDTNRRPMVDISEIDYPLKPSVNFQLKPSLGSAFQPLRSTQ